MTTVNLSANMSLRDSTLTITTAATATTSSSGLYQSRNQNVGTAFEPLDLGDLTNVKYLYVKNNYTTSIDVSMHSLSQSFAVLKENDFILLPPSGSFITYQVRSTQMSGSIQTTAVEQ